MRFSQEVQWADEDVQIGVLEDLASNAAIALGRALDLVGTIKSTHSQERYQAL